MRRLHTMGCLVLVCLAVVGAVACARLGVARYRQLTVARRALVPLMSLGQFARSAQAVRVGPSAVSFTIKGTGWTVHPAPPPVDVPLVARRGRLLSSVEGQVHYSGEIGRVLGVLPCRVAAYEFPGRTVESVTADLEREGWKTAAKATEELRRQARAQGLDPAKLPGGDPELPSMGGRLMYPPLPHGPRPERWGRTALLSHGANGAVLQCLAFDAESALSPGLP